MGIVLSHSRPWAIPAHAIDTSYLDLMKWMRKERREMYREKTSLFQLFVQLCKHSILPEAERVYQGRKEVMLEINHDIKYLRSLPNWLGRVKNISDRVDWISRWGKRMVLKVMSKIINDIRKSLYSLYGIWALFSARAFSTVNAGHIALDNPRFLIKK